MLIPSREERLAEEARRTEEEKLERLLREEQEEAARMQQIEELVRMEKVGCFRCVVAMREPHNCLEILSNSVCLGSRSSVCGQQAQKKVRGT